MESEREKKEADGGGGGGGGGNNEVSWQELPQANSFRVEQLFYAVF